MLDWPTSATAVRLRARHPARRSNVSSTSSNLRPMLHIDLNDELILSVDDPDSGHLERSRIKSGRSECGSIGVGKLVQPDGCALLVDKIVQLEPAITE